MTGRRSCGMLRGMRMRTLFLLAAMVGSGCSGGSSPPATTPPPVLGPPVDLKVMTRNLFLGADLLPVVTVMTVDEIPPKVKALWTAMQMSDLPGRAKLLAAEIAAARPDVVGLQEAVTFYKQTPSDFSFVAPMNNASTVEFDFVAALINELRALGAEYEPAATLENSDVELPAADDAGPFDVRMTDRIAILARKGLPVSGRQSSHYATHVPFTIPISAPVGAPRAPVDLVRGVLLVELTIEGQPVTFATTQLEVSGGPGDVLRPIQEMQARDLVRALEPIKGPLVVTGDFNSPADPPAGPAVMNSYDTVAAAFTDAWTQVNPTLAGFTCCADLDNQGLMHQQRIDFILHRGGITTTSAEVVGTSGQTMTGLRASRHAGVVATLKIPRTR